MGLLRPSSEHGSHAQSLLHLRVRNISHAPSRTYVALVAYSSTSDVPGTYRTGVPAELSGHSDLQIVVNSSL